MMYVRALYFSLLSLKIFAFVLLCSTNVSAAVSSDWRQENIAAIETDYNNDGFLDIVLLKKRSLNVPYSIELFFGDSVESYVLLGSELGDFGEPTLIMGELEVDDFARLAASIGSFMGEEGEQEILIRTFDAVDPNSDPEAIISSTQEYISTIGDQHKATVIISGIQSDTLSASTYANINYRNKENIEIDGEISKYVVFAEPPNEARFSINTAETVGFTSSSSFLVDKPLQIVSLAPSVVKNDSDERILVPPPIVIVVADTIDLNNQIELIGPATDILFVATGNGSTAGSINCNNCEFKNFHRVTFVVAEPELGPITSSLGTVGNLSTSPNGVINISNLTAPGVLEFDALANDINLSGEINVHERVVKDLLGGYVNNPSGTHTIGTGAVSLYLGSITWDYEEKLIRSLLDSTYSSTLGDQFQLGGSIKALNVNITSSAGLTLDTNIETETDLVSTVRFINRKPEVLGDLTFYNYLTYLTEEKVEVQALGECQWYTESDCATPTLRIGNNVQSSENVEFRSFTSIELSSPVMSVKSKNVSIIAQHTIFNDANVQAEQLSVLGYSVENEGLLEGFLKVEVAADKLISNQFGGKIKGTDVKLDAGKYDEISEEIIELGIIINGSRTPYKQTEKNVIELLSFADGYVEALNPLELGTFYMDEVDVVTSLAPIGSLVMQSVNSAHILGETVSITSTGFENINPYYKKWNEQFSNSFDFDKELSKQVSTIAEKSLKIHASNYIHNSSAILMVGRDNLNEGKMELKTGMLTNERYRINSEITYGYSYENFDTGSVRDLNRDDEVTTYKQNALYLPWSFYNSPPGIILSMGDVDIQAMQGFLNNVAYFEIFGNAQFTTPLIHDLGHNMSSAQEESYWETRRDLYASLSNGDIIVEDDFVTDAAFCEKYLAGENPTHITDLYGNPKYFVTRDDYYKKNFCNNIEYHQNQHVLNEETTSDTGQEHENSIDEYNKDMDSLFFIHGTKSANYYSPADVICTECSDTYETAIFKNHNSLKSLIGLALDSYMSDRFSYYAETVEWQRAQLTDIIESGEVLNPTQQYLYDNIGFEAVVRDFTSVSGYAAMVESNKIFVDTSWRNAAEDDYHTCSKYDEVGSAACDNLYTSDNTYEFDVYFLLGEYFNEISQEGREEEKDWWGEVVL